MKNNKSFISIPERKIIEDEKIKQDVEDFIKKGGEIYKAGDNESAIEGSPKPKPYNNKGGKGLSE